MSAFGQIKMSARVAEDLADGLRPSGVETVYAATDAIDKPVGTDTKRLAGATLRVL